MEKILIELAARAAEYAVKVFLHGLDASICEVIENVHN